MEKVKCNLCGSDNDTEVYKNDEVRYVICDDCSLVYLNPRSTQQEYSDFYNKDYQRWRHQLYSYEQSVIRRNLKSDAPKWRRAKLLEGYIAKNSKVLEIGSGWGTFLKVIQDKFDCEGTGIEISEVAARLAKNYYNLNIYHQTFEDYLKEGLLAGQAGKKEKFDSVLMVHVLEHFTDPLRSLFGISQILNDDGCVYIAVPNIMSLDEPLDRFFQFAHCYYFSLLTLKKILLKTGFKIVRQDLSSREIKIIAVKTSNSKQEIDTSKFEKIYSKEKALRAIKNQDIKYKILRFLKKISEAILPKKISLLLKKMVIKILKKTGIIEV